MDASPHAQALIRVWKQKFICSVLQREGKVDEREQVVGVAEGHVRSDVITIADCLDLGGYL
jgi:hypothetical protein